LVVVEKTILTGPSFTTLFLSTTTPTPTLPSPPGLGAAEGEVVVTVLTVLTVLTVAVAVAVAVGDCVLLGLCSGYFNRSRDCTYYWCLSLSLGNNHGHGHFNNCGCCYGGRRESISGI
jgi:hypothetical protein